MAFNSQTQLTLPPFPSLNQEMSASSLLLLFSHYPNLFCQLYHNNGSQSHPFSFISMVSALFWIINIFLPCSLLGLLTSYLSKTQYLSTLSPQVFFFLFLKCRSDVSLLLKNLLWLSCISKLKHILLSMAFITV